MIVLASASPRRHELLAQAGFTFIVHAADIDETRRAGEAPVAFVLRLAEEKARAVAAKFPDAVVLAADTVVVVDEEILGKPRDAADARRMLRMLAGRVHQVLTGVAVLRGERCATAVETTMVSFAEIGEEELERYVASGEPMDKAGAYGIQGYAARWIPRIEGDYYNVVGLPVARVVAMLGAAGAQRKLPMYEPDRSNSRFSQAPVRDEVIDATVIHAVEWDENYFKFCEFSKFEIISGKVSSDFTSCSFTNTDWHMGIFVLSSFNECAFTDCVFRGVSFSDCKFIHCVLNNCRFIKDELGCNCVFPDTVAYGCEVIGGEGFEAKSDVASNA